MAQGETEGLRTLDQIADLVRRWKIHLQDWVTRSDEFPRRCHRPFGADDDHTPEGIEEALFRELTTPLSDTEYLSLLSALRLQGYPNHADTIEKDWDQVLGKVWAERERIESEWDKVQPAAQEKEGNTDGHDPQYFQLDAIRTAAGNLASTLDTIERILGCQTGPCTHAIDFRCVNWFGGAFSFTSYQAPCVRVWWEHWQRGTPDVADETVLDAAECESSRISDLFKNHPAWGTMILPGGTKGTHRLQEITASPKPSSRKKPAKRKHPTKKK